MAESPWLAQVRRALGSRPDIMMWRQHAGLYCPVNKPDVKIRVAPDGIGDCMGVQMRRVAHRNVAVMETVNPDGMQPHERQIEWFYGQAIAIETKAATGKQRESQEDFEHAFVAMGGHYIVAHENEWDVLWRALGEEPDPLCAEKAQELWATIDAQRKERKGRKKA